MVVSGRDGVENHTHLATIRVLFLDEGGSQCSYWRAEGFVPAGHGCV